MKLSKCFKGIYNTELGKYKRMRKIHIILSLSLYIPIQCLYLCLPISGNVFADQFAQQNGNTAVCLLSFASTITYSQLPADEMFNPNGYISYDSTKVNGTYFEQGSNKYVFSNFGTDVYPIAQRYNGIATNLSVPPGTNVDLTAFLKNDDNDIISLPSGGYQFLSLPSANGNLMNLMSSTDNLPISYVNSTVNYNGSILTRSGYAFKLPDLGDIFPNMLRTIPLVSFTTITPIVASRQITATYNNAGDIIINASLSIKNQSNYIENNISVSDFTEFNSPYNHIINSIAPNSTTTLTYSEDIGSTYPESLIVGPASINIPSSETEVFASYESNYGLSANAISTLIPRNDPDSDTSDIFFQQNLPLLSSGDMSLTLLPYTYYTNINTVPLNPQLKIVKLQNGTENTIQVNLGDTINYSIQITNTGDYPVSLIGVFDDVPPQVTVTQASPGYLYCNGLVSQYYSQTRRCSYYEMNWAVPVLFPGASETFTFSSIVNSSAVPGDDISNSAYVVFNYNGMLLSNFVDANTLLQQNTVNAINQTFFSTSSNYSLQTGDIAGLVWNDYNMDGIFNNGESPINNADVFYTVNNVTKETYTNNSGVYMLSGIPMNDKVSIYIPTPKGYTYKSTYSKYSVVLLTNCTHMFSTQNYNYTVNGSVLNVNACGYFNGASLGVYNNNTFQDTGARLNYILLIFPISIIFLSIYIFSMIQLRKVC